MKKSIVATPSALMASFALASVGGMLPLTVGAATVYGASESALSQDHLLHDAAMQQQAHTPLLRMPRHHATGRDAVADPDAIYVQYDQGDTEHAGIPGEADITVRSPLMLTGGEYQISPQWLVGGNVGRLEQSLQFDDSGDSIDTRAHVATLYTQWGKNGFTATTLVGHQRGELSSERRLENGRLAQGEADTRQSLFSIAGRYAFHDGGWRYGPFSRLDVSRGDIEAYREHADNILIDWQNRTSESRVFSMGVHGAYLFDVGAGSIAPYAMLATRKELQNKRDTLNGLEWAGDTASSLNNAAEARDERWHEATVGLRLALEKQLLINAEFTQALDWEAQDLQSLTLRADWIFRGL